MWSADAPRSSRLLIARVVVLAATVGWNFGLIGPVIGSLSASFGVGLAAIGLLATVLSVAHTATQVPSSWPIARFGALRVARWGTLLMAAGNLLAVVSGWYAVLAVSRVAVGLGSGPVFVAGIDGARRLGGTVLASVFGGATMLGLGAALLVGALLDAAGAPWSAAFAVAAAVDLLACFVCPRDAPAAAEGAAPASVGLRRTMATGAIWRLTLLYSATFGTTLVVGAWVVEYLHVGGLAKWQAGSLGFCILVASGAARWVGGELLERGIPWLAIGPISTVVGGLALLALALQPAPVVLIPLSIAIGIGLALPFGGIVAFAVRARRDAPAAAIAVVNSVASAFALVVIPLGGWLMDRGDGAALFVAVGLIALVAALANWRPAVS